MTEKLLETLSEEDEALRALHSQFSRMRDELRDQQVNQLETITREASNLLSEIDRLAQARARQMRLARRLLGLDDHATLDDVAAAMDEQGAGQLARRLRRQRDQIRTRAQQIQEQANELTFALEYASSLGREMLSILRGASSSAPAQGYTKRGGEADTDPDSLVNTVG